MKIGNPQSPSQSTPLERPRDADAPRPEHSRQDDSHGKRFGSALEKKASEKKHLERHAASNDPMTPAFPAQLPFQPQSFASPIESTATGAVAGVLPPEITALSGEILHALEVNGPNEVRIQFDAAVLDGLSVTLTKEGGALHVSLQAASPEMARFLEVHAASLAQSLERPERAAFISIETRPHAGDHHGGRGQGGGGRHGDGDEQPDHSPAGDEA